MPVDADRGRQVLVATRAPRVPGSPVVWWGRDFPGDEEQVRLARHWIEDLLPACDPLADLALLASELCANAVMHTRSGTVGGRFTVDVEWTPQAARVVVGDQGSPTAPAVTARVQDGTWPGENGRGLWLVDELADDWGTASHAGYRWTWAETRWQARGGPPLQAPGGWDAVSAGTTVTRAAFPGTTIWWGHRTCTWWAAVPGATDAGGMASAPTRGELCQMLMAACPDLRSRDHVR